MQKLDKANKRFCTLACFVQELDLRSTKGQYNSELFWEMQLKLGC